MNAKQGSVKSPATSSPEFLFPLEGLKNAKGGRGKWRIEGGGLVERQIHDVSGGGTATGIHALSDLALHSENQLQLCSSRFAKCDGHSCQCWRRFGEYQVVQLCNFPSSGTYGTRDN